MSMVSVSTMIIVLRDHIITVLNWREKKTLQHHTMFLEISIFFIEPDSTSHFME